MQQLFSGKLKDENGNDYADWEEKVGVEGRLLKKSTNISINKIEGSEFRRFYYLLTSGF
jgi:hypothetical protein